MINKIGVVAGSFDPITNGHMWLIRAALSIVDVVHVVIGQNPAKPGYFTHSERERQVRSVLSDCLDPWDYDRIQVGECSGFLVEYASSVGADCIIRGLRNTADFLYEQQIQAVNAKIRQGVNTIYLIPPSEYLEVSSSTVRGLVGVAGWESVVGQYVHPVILGDLACRTEQSRG